MGLASIRISLNRMNRPPICDTQPTPQSLVRIRDEQRLCPRSGQSRSPSEEEGRQIVAMPSDLLKTLHLSADSDPMRLGFLLQRDADQ